MRALFVLARYDARMYRDLSGNSVFAGLPFQVVLFVDKANAEGFRALGSDLAIEVVRWSDLKAVQETAVRTAASYDVAAVATVDEELIEEAAQLRQRLGVPGMSPEVAARFRDKVEMKRAVAAAGVRVPEFVACAERDRVDDLLRRHGKLVIKPVRGLGSRGVQFASSRAELDAWYRACQFPEGFEAEEFVQGVLYHVNAVVRGGKPVITVAAPYLPGKGNIDFSSGSPFVTVTEDDPRLTTALTAFSDRALAALELQNGITHLECFVTSSGEIVFCEVGVRPGGGGDRVDDRGAARDQLQPRGAPTRSWHGRPESRYRSARARE